MMSRITLNLRKNMDVSNTASSKYSAIGDIALESLATPPKTTQNRPGQKRHESA